MPRLNLQGAVAIVTGGASGIGEQCAHQLSALGMTVFVADLNEELGRRVAEEISGEFVRCDITDEAGVAAMVAEASANSPLRVVVNSAGIGTAARTVGRGNVPVAQSQFESIIRVNLLGTFNVLRQAAAAIAKTEPLEDGARGVIVNVASIAAFDGQVGQAGYSASKGGIVGMTLPIARDLAPMGIRVNTVAPGLIDTPIYGTGDAAEEFKASLGASAIFPKRLGSAEELAFAIIDCITNPFVNGETIRVDGAVRLPAR